MNVSAKQNPKTKYIAIIDAYSSGNTLAKLFKQYGYNILHIRSTNKLHPYYLDSFEKIYFSADIDYINDCDGSFTALCDKLSEYSLLFAIAGIDSASYLTDKINHYFKLPGNSLALSLVRKNKYLQQEHLQHTKLSSLSSSDYYLTDELTKLEAWLNQYNEWPVIIKPIESANSQDVKLCQNLADAQQAFKKIMQTTINQCGAYNTAVLAEKYLIGREYRVNTVSYQGRHYLAEIWDVTKQINQTNDFIYHKISLIHPHSAICSQLKNYIFKLLDQFEVTHGPGAADIMLTKSGPVLIEISTRLMGEIAPENLLKTCLPITQAQAAYLAYSKPENFFAHLDQTKQQYEVNNYFEIYFVKSEITGKIKKINFLDKIKQLDSVVSINLLVNIGDSLSITTDYGSSPMQIILSHQNKNQVQKDCEKIEDYNNQHIFVV